MASIDHDGNFSIRAKGRNQLANSILQLVLAQSNDLLTAANSLFFSPSPARPRPVPSPAIRIRQNRPALFVLAALYPPMPYRPFRCGNNRVQAEKSNEQHRDEWNRKQQRFPA
jgi:hypothetical protein